MVMVAPNSNTRAGKSPVASGTLIAWHYREKENRSWLRGVVAMDTAQLG